jgi:hypothetical protein
LKIPLPDSAEPFVALDLRQRSVLLREMKGGWVFCFGNHMKKIDLKKELKHLYQPSAKEASIVRVPKFNYLMIDGAGDPNTSKEFQDAIQALFSMSYTMKFMYRKEKDIDYPVMALEGFWWMKEGVEFDWNASKEFWRWTLMMMQPKYVTKALVKKAQMTVTLKAQRAAVTVISALDKMRFESWNEGMSAQIMHVGPFSEERPTIERLHAFINDSGYEIAGKHHEIYLNDFRRVKPEKMKTVIRYAVKKR